MVRILILAAAIVVGACGGGGAAGGDCAGLDLATCRLTDGCEPDLCDACSCEPSYRGCIGAGRTPEPCPELGCASPDCCATQSQCVGGVPCAPPGTPFGCGICNPDPGTCTDDAMCQAIDPTTICEPISCTCDGARACVPGCLDGMSCAEGATCDSELHRCVAQTCADAAGCPDNFDCADARCVRRTCTDDLVCDGYCVEGACYDGRGECRPPVP